MTLFEAVKKYNPYLHTSREGHHTWALGAILLIALTLRLWGVDFGLPYRTHSHEYHEVHRALRLGMGEFDFTRTMKGGYFYFLFIEYGILFVAMFLTGQVASVKEFSFLYLTDPTIFWLIGRITTAVLGTATIFVTFLIIKRLIGGSSALIGTALFAILPLHVELSHYISVDVPMVFFLTLTFYFSLKIFERESLRDYLLVGFFFALAVMNKFPAILFSLPLVIAYVVMIRRSGDIRRRFLNKKVFYGFITFLVIYVLGNPGVLLEFQKSLNIVLGLVYKTDLGLEGVGGGGSLLGIQTEPFYLLPSNFARIFW